MKKLFVLLFVLGFVGLLQAQWVFESFDNAVGPVAGATGPLFADVAVLNTNFYANGLTAFMDLTNDPDHMEGTGSMKIDYRVEARDGWGGYCVRTNYHDFDVTQLPNIDLSTGTHLKLRYKVLTPADTSQDGTVFMEIKLAEIDEAGNRDLWLHHMALNPFDASGTWQEVTMPLEKNADNTLGFSLQFGGGDGELQLDKVRGLEMSVVYITAGGTVNTPFATGSILIDKLELVGNRYSPFQTFDNAATDVFTFDDMSWAGPSGKGSVVLSNNTTDFVEGTGSMQLDYTVNASQGWGGYINMTDTTWVFPDSFANRTALVLYVKNVNPLTGTTPQRVTCRFFLMENSTGANEDWVIEVPINFEEAGEWTRYYLPLKQDTVWTDSAGKTRFPQTGFAQTWWSITGDNIFNQGSITGYKIEFSAGGNDYGPQNEIFTGQILFDVLQQSGFKFDDTEAPAAPVVQVIMSSFSNLVTWIDVPGETGETYSIYYSANPITDVAADGVEPLYTVSAIPENTSVYVHQFYSAKIDKDRTFYYAVTCKDFAGNVSSAGTFGPVTNKAKGVPTVSINPPTAFVADGNISEWDGITPFVMSAALGTANVPPPPQVVDGDADCSAEVKVALDNTYLYVMMDVTDDAVFWVDDASTWQNDAADLYIGFYDSTETHRAYWRGTKPDYHIRFGKFKIRNDGGGAECDSVIANGNTDIVPIGGSENYYWGEKFPSGYIIEARIPLIDLATKRNSPSQTTDVISWKVGDRIPFDIGINDNDGNEADAGHAGVDRQGMIFYSPSNRDNGWRYVDSWTYTWISDEVTGVDDQPNLVNVYNLNQNYPNPFNPSTKITYSIAEPGLVSIKVFDILGRQVADLVNKQQSAGSYTVDFDAQNLSAGGYLYKIESGSFQAAKKMILLK